jgi:hypothetical protein
MLKTVDAGATWVTTQAPLRFGAGKLLDVYYEVEGTARWVDGQVVYSVKVRGMFPEIPNVPCISKCSLNFEMFPEFSNVP